MKTTQRRGFDSTWWSDYQSTHPVMAEVRYSWDSGDQWGTVMGWHFAVCEVLSAMDEDIPAHWEFRRGANPASTLAELAEEDDAIPYEDHILAGMVLAYQTTAEDLRYAGEVLHRYAHTLKRAGVDY